MANNNEAVKLIINNIQSLDDAVSFLEGEMSEKFMGVLDTVVKDKVESLDSEWRGVFELYSDSIQFSPLSWEVESNDDFKHQNCYARYRLTIDSEFIEVEKDTNYWLTDLFAESPNRIIFAMTPWYANFMKCTRAQWRNFATDQNQKTPEIEKLGFKYVSSEGEWYLPVGSLDKSLVIDGYANDSIEDALTPFVAALDTLYQAHPYFDRIIEAAKEHFGKKED